MSKPSPRDIRREREHRKKFAPTGFECLGFGERIPCANEGDPYFCADCALLRDAHAETLADLRRKLGL